MNIKTFVIKLGEELFIPTCSLMIVYCLFYQYIANIPYIFIIKLILLISFAFQLIAWITGIRQSNQNDTDKKSVIKNKIIKYLYLNAGQIITQVFCYYFAVYLIFMLDKKSILFNYLVLLLFGLFLGYRIALRTRNSS
jgi:hypothetical protein